MSKLSPATRDQLTRVSTATLTTALFKRGLRNQFLQGVSPVAPKGRNMVGPAFTLRYIPAREDLNPLSVFQNPQHPQRHAIETCPEGHVMVIDSRKDPRTINRVTRIAPAEAARGSLRLSITSTAPGGQTSTALRCGCSGFLNTSIVFRSSRAGM